VIYFQDIIKNELCSCDATPTTIVTV